MSTTEEILSVTVTDDDGNKYWGVAPIGTDEMTIVCEGGTGAAFVTSVPFDLEVKAANIPKNVLRYAKHPVDFTIDRLCPGDFLYCASGCYWGVVNGENPVGRYSVYKIIWYKWAFDSGDVMHDWVRSDDEHGMKGFDVVVRKNVPFSELDVRYVIENELPKDSVVELARRVSRMFTSRGLQILYVTTAP